MNDRDTGYAPAVWEFDEEVSRVFADMLDRSVPQLETMRSAVRSVAAPFLRSETVVIDLGCSTGDAIESLRDLWAPKTVVTPDGELDVSHYRTEPPTFLGIESSAPMAERAERRFERNGNVEIIRHDLRDGLPPIADDASVVLSVLTLMFVPINYRPRLVHSVYRQLRDGGAFILVEKVLGESAELDAILVRNYEAKKIASGYTLEEVERKRLSLEGVLVPLTSSWNVELLRRAGFREVELFWAWMNFRAWVAVR